MDPLLHKTCWFEVSAKSNFPCWLVMCRGRGSFQVKKLLFCQPQLVAMRTGYVDCAVARLLGQLSSADCAVYRLLQVSLDFIVSRLLGQWN